MAKAKAKSVKSGARKGSAKKGSAKKAAARSAARPTEDWSSAIKKAAEQKKQPPQWPGGGADAWKRRSKP